MKKHRWISILTVLALTLGACTTAAEDDPATPDSATATGGTATEPTDGAATPEGDRLAAVQARGELNCGVNGAVPGFGFSTAEGDFAGFDIDYCKAVAAAVLGDAEAVNFMPLDAAQRFTSLQSGEIDVLIRNTTWTGSRDGGEGATFLTTTFYDGQGMMVRTDSGITDIEGLENAAICVLTGTTTELNLATRMGDIAYTPLTFDDNETLQAAFLAGQCEGWTSDKSQLSGIRSQFPEAEGGPEALTILDETFSKEPLGPVVADGDSQWAQIVDWVVIGTIAAEELGIDSSNVTTFGDSDNDEIRRLLGLEVTETADDGTETAAIFDAGLGIEPGWLVPVIEAVGNYGEIYARNVGPETSLGLERGVNALWTDGGLLYAPPYR